MGSGYAVGGSVRMMDDGRSTNIPGKKEGKSTVSGLWRNLVAGLLDVHRQTHHGVDAEGRNQWETPYPDGEPQMYWVSLPTAAGPW